MLLYNSQDIRQADMFAISELGVPPLLLMENAARGVAEAVTRRFPSAKKILVACGGGNNGGDGVAAARHLMSQGREVNVLLTVPVEKSSEEMKINLGIYKKMGGDPVSSSNMSDSELRSLFQSMDLVIDALLGTGAAGSPRGEVLRAIRSISSTVPVASIDIPSGVDASSGEVQDVAVRADLTVSILARKTGLEIMPGRSRRGSIETVGLGIPSGLVLEQSSYCELFCAEDVSDHLPGINSSMHKGDRGGVLVIGGSERYRGAPVLSALGALSAGAGIVIAAVPACSIPMFSPYPEMIIMEADTENGCMSPPVWDKVLEQWGGRFNSVVIGPGIDRGKSSQALFKKVWKEWKGVICVDGDALYALSQCTGSITRQGPTIITPHEGEAASLLSTTREKVSSRRLYSAKELSSLFGTVLLKGPGSLVLHDGMLRIIPFLVPALSVPGSGDVLSGIIGAFSAAGLDCFDATASGAYIHGSAGRSLQEEKGFDGVTASQIASAVPFEISRLRTRHLKGDLA